MSEQNCRIGKVYFKSSSEPLTFTLKVSGSENDFKQAYPEPYCFWLTVFPRLASSSRNSRMEFAADDEVKLHYNY